MNALIIYNSLGGRTLKAARFIQEITKGGVYEIKTQKKQGVISLGYLALFGRFFKMPLPSLINDFPNIEAYDKIFIGAPIYAGNIPPALESFLLQMDFKGKVVIPFATFGGGAGKYFEIFKKKIKNARIIDGEAFNMKDKDIESKIKSFADRICKTNN